MPLEIGTYISDLNASNPVGASDPKSQGDNHLRLIKSTVKATFPNISGAMTLTHTQLNSAAIKTEANIFTANQRIKLSAPNLTFQDDSSAVDTGVARFQHNSNVFRLQFLNDAENNANAPWSITRTGNFVDLQTFTTGDEETAMRLVEDGAAELYHNGGKTFETQTGGITVRRASGDDPFIQWYQDDDSTRNGFIQFHSTQGLLIRNEVHGANLTLSAEDALGGTSAVLTGDPDGSSQLYWSGAQSFRTEENGVALADPFGNPEINFYNINYTSRRGQIRFTGTDAYIDNEVHGGRVILSGEDAGGVSRNVFLGDPDSQARLYYNGVARFETSAGGTAAIFSDGSTDTENRFLGLFHAAGTRRGYMGHDSTGVLAIENEIHGANVVLRGEDLSGTLKTMFSGDPDGQALIYYAGTLRFESRANGVMGLRSDGNSDSEDRYIDFMHANGSRRAIIGHITGSNLSIRNAVHGANVQIQAEDSGGSVRNLMLGDPDGSVTLYEDALACFRTSDYTAADIGTGAQVFDGDGEWRPVGFNVLPLNGGFGSANQTLSLSNVGDSFEYNTSTARSLFINSDGNIPVGASWSLTVGPSGGTLTADGGTGVTIRYWNGASYTTTAAGGNITLGEGRHFIYKIADTQFQIDGPNIS